jgi:hypothetical protein
MPLGKLLPEQLEQIQIIVNATLDKKEIQNRISQCFHNRAGEQCNAE